jgi:hypothetical protein
MLKILDKSKGGIDMNLLGFHFPNRIYYSDSCPAGLGGYRDQGFTWRFRIPDNLLFRVSNNLVEFSCSNYHAVDRHNWWMTQPRGLHTVDDRQHNGQRLDEKNELQQSRQ